MGWGLVGHREAVVQLSRALATGRLAHAYLFVGPKGVGKGTLARALAQAVNCSAAEPPCGECASCRRIGAGKHADVRVLAIGVKDVKERAERKERTEIGFEQVEELQRLAALRPFEGTYRVFIVDGAERLSAPAANRLLKTLEEPPPQVLLILLTANERELLPTLFSRCQPIRLRALAEADVQAALRERGMADEEARRVARLAQGRIGWALAVAADGALLQKREERLDQVFGLTEADREQRFAFATEMETLFRRNREEGRAVLELWREWWRDLLLWKTGMGEWATNLDRHTAAEAQAARLELGEIAATLRRLDETAAALEANVTPRLALDVLMLAMPRVDAGTAGQQVRAPETVQSEA
ncbi:MAG: DNA polymerase III subunit delta' [Dehalococcoidia bacterium]|nr:DNA polymerase III subunit delta' [Dehalococcoidia bacterium]